MPIPSTSKETVTVDSLLYWVTDLSNKHNLSGEVKDMLLEQVVKLGVIYGKEINKRDALEVISRQLEITKTGYIQEPVDIVEFMESPEYWNQGAYVRPAIMDHLIKLFDPARVYYEVSAGGGIGIGKNYFIDGALAYDIYRMSCLYSPQSHFGLAPGSDIIIVHQSKSLALAKKVVFGQFSSRIALSGYFPKHFQPSPQHKAELRFPHNITVMPVSGTDTAAIGMNIYLAVLDELNFLKRVKKKTDEDDEDQKEQAEKNYDAIVGRIESRYKLLGNPNAMGRVYMISSARSEGDFIDNKEKEAKTNPHIFVMHLAQWESFPPEVFKTGHFYVEMPEGIKKGKIHDTRPKTGNILKVPNEFKPKFEKNLLSALRDIAGKAIPKKGKYIDDFYITNASNSYEAIYGKEQIFISDSLDLDKKMEDMVNIPLMLKLKYQGPFALHLDLALTICSAGMAISHVIGSKNPGAMMEFNAVLNNFVASTSKDFPIYGVPGLARIAPPSGGEINLGKVGQLVLLVSKFLDIKWVTLDRWQSAYLIQFFRENDMSSNVISVDRSPDPYDVARAAIMEDRVIFPISQILKDEFKGLHRDAITGIVDHGTGGSKDITDSITGSVYNLSLKRSSYRVLGAPKPFHGTIRAPRKGDDRPSSGREPMY